jgi:hypothetical protein
MRRAYMNRVKRRRETLPGAGAFSRARGVCAMVALAQIAVSAGDFHNSEDFNGVNGKGYVPAEIHEISARIYCGSAATAASTRRPLSSCNADTGALELFISCESSYPSVSVKWGDSEREKSAQKVSHFLSLPSVSAQVILDKATECFSVLKGEQGMTTVFFDHVELRCGVGPDIAWGRIVVRVLWLICSDQRRVGSKVRSDQSAATGGIRLPEVLGALVFGTFPKRSKR